MSNTELDEEAYLAECVGLNELDLDREYRQMGAAVAFWNARYADAFRAAAHAKRAMEDAEAEALLTVRATERALEKKDRRTVDEVNASVRLEEGVQAAHIRWVEREADRVRLKGIVDAVMVKKDMLQSLGAKIRMEMQADPTVRARYAGETLAWGRE